MRAQARISPHEPPCYLRRHPPAASGQPPGDGRPPGPHLAARHAGASRAASPHTLRAAGAAHRRMEPAPTSPAGRSQPSGGRPRADRGPATPYSPPPCGPPPPARCRGGRRAGRGGCRPARLHQPPPHPSPAGNGRGRGRSLHLAVPLAAPPRRAGRRRPVPLLPQPPAPAARESGGSRRRGGQGRGGQSRKCGARRKSGGRRGSQRCRASPAPARHHPVGAPRSRHRGAGAAPSRRRAAASSCPVPPAPRTEGRRGSAAGSGLRQSGASAAACGKARCSSRSIPCPALPSAPAAALGAGGAGRAQRRVSRPDRRRWSCGKAARGKS